MAMLSAPFGCTHPPPPIRPFLLKQNLSPKVILEVMSQDESFMQDISGSIWERVKTLTSFLHMLKQLMKVSSTDLEIDSV